MTIEATKPALVTRKPGDIARKVIAFTVAGITSTGVVAVAGIFGLELGPEVAAALVTILGFVAAYFTRDRATS